MKKICCLLVIALAFGCGRGPCFVVNVHCEPTVTYDCETRAQCHQMARWLIDEYPDECTGYSIGARDPACVEEETEE